MKGRMKGRMKEKKRRVRSRVGRRAKPSKEKRNRKAKADTGHT